MAPGFEYRSLSARPLGPGRGNCSSQEAGGEQDREAEGGRSAPGEGPSPGAGTPAATPQRFMPLTQRRTLQALVARSSHIKFLELSQVVVILCSVDNSLILTWLPIKRAHEERGWPEERNVYSISRPVPHRKWARWHAGFLRRSPAPLAGAQAFGSEGRGQNDKVAVPLCRAGASTGVAAAGTARPGGACFGESR